MKGLKSLDEFKACLRRELVGPQDAAYDVARKDYNGMIDRPSLTIRCADVADVISAVNCAKEKNRFLPLAAADTAGQSFLAWRRSRKDVDCSRARVGSGLSHATVLAPMRTAANMLHGERCFDDLFSDCGR